MNTSNQNRHPVTQLRSSSQGVRLPATSALYTACAMALAFQVIALRAEASSPDDMQQLIERYSQPVEDLSSVVARASGGAAHAHPAHPVAQTLPQPTAVAAAVHVAVDRIKTGHALKVQHAGLNMSPSAQVQAVMQAIAQTDIGSSTHAQIIQSGFDTGGAAVHGLAHELQSMIRPRDPLSALRAQTVLNAAGAVLGSLDGVVGGALDVTLVGPAANHVLDGTGHVVGGVGQLTGGVLAGATGSYALGSTVTGTTAALAGGLDRIGDQLDATHLAGTLGHTVGTVHDVSQALLLGTTQTAGGILGSTQLSGGVTSTVGQVTGGLANGVTSLVGGLTGNVGSLPVVLPVPPTGVIGGGIGGSGAFDLSLGLGGLTGALGGVEGTVGHVLDVTLVGPGANHLLTGTGHVVNGAGHVLGGVVGGLTGSAGLGSTLSNTTLALQTGLSATGNALDGTNLAGTTGQLLGTVHTTTQALLQGTASVVGGVTGSSTLLTGVADTVGGITGGLANGTSNLVGSLTGNPSSTPVPDAPLAGGTLTGGVGGSLTGTVGGLVGGVVGGIGGIFTPGTGPTGLAPDDPRRVPVGTGSGGLVVGNGGLVGTVSSMLTPTAQELLGGDGYIRNGSTTINSANFTQAYSVTNVLGVPVVNLSPVGTLLDGLGGVGTGSNSNLTVIGGATSDSYITNINNGAPGGLLGLVLPNQAPDWADSCLNPLGIGLVSVDCWAVNAAQDYQVLIGDGAYANGSKEVVIGTNAQHRLPTMTADQAFAGNGSNDPTNPSGVPTADYDARMGHSVVIGDNALGTANAQTLLGAGATSNKANSVAIGFKSDADRGGLDNYTAFGLTAPQLSIGEFAVGSEGRNRQITHVAAGSQDHDAVNVMQLRSALDAVTVGADPLAVRYDAQPNGDPDYTRITLGNGQHTKISGLAGGTVHAQSDQAIHGGQLHATASGLISAIGGGAQVNAFGEISQVSFGHRAIDAHGQAVATDFNSVADTLESMDDSIFNINGRITATGERALKYDLDANGAIDHSVATLGDGNGTTRLTNLSNGAVTAASSDAVTGSQLHGSQMALAGVLGGQASVDANGQLLAPTYSLTSVAADGTTTVGDYNDVGSAFEAVDGSLVNINNKFNTMTARAVKYDLDARGAIDYSVATLGNGNGTTRLTNLSNGAVTAASSDAVTGSQLHGTQAALAGVLGGQASVDANGQLLAPTYSLTSVAADGTTTMGDYNDVGSAFEAVDGSLVNITNNFNTMTARAVKYDLDANGDIDYSVATLGDGKSTTRLTNLSNGAVTAASSDAVTGSQLHGSQTALAGVLGGQASVDANGQLLAPTYSLTSVAADGSTTVGDYNDVGSAFEAVDGSLVNINNTLNDIDTNINTMTARAVKYDLDANGDIDYSVATLGDGNGTTRLTNLSNGAVTAASNDAVTGSQIHGTATSIATHLGGGAQLDANGVVSAPSYSLSVIDASGQLGVSTFDNVGSAFDAVGQSLSWVFNNGGTGGTDPLAVHYDTNASGQRQNSITLQGSAAGAAVAIGNVAAGQVSATSRDAVNGTQLAATNQAITTYLGSTTAYNAVDGSWVGPNFALNVVGTDGKLTQVNYSDVGSAFDSVSRSLGNLAVQPGTAAPVIDNMPYLDVNSAGPAAQAGGQEAIALGASSTAAGTASVAIGQGASAVADNAVAIGAGSTADRANTVSVGRAGAERQVTHVADGTADTDAINVRQLNASQQGSVRYDNNVDGTTNYASITMGRPAYAPTLIRNVAAGVADTDAVNVGQLQSGLNQAMDWSKRYTDDRFSAISHDMKEIDNRASAGVASAMAMAGLPQPFEAGRSMAAVAASTFNGESSLAVGISGVSEGGRWIYKISGSANSRGDGGVTLGAGMQW